MEDLGVDDMIRFVGRRRGEATKVSGVFIRQCQADLLIQLAQQRIQWRLAGLDLAARQHEPPCARLSDQQQSPGAIVDQGGGDTDRPRRSSLVHDAARCGRPSVMS